MKIEITPEQFNQIQNEIIRLEQELTDNRDKLSGWDFVYYDDTIATLKKILEDEGIDLSQINI